MRPAILVPQRINLIPADLRPSWADHRTVLLLAALALVGTPALGMIAKWARWGMEKRLETLTLRRDEVNKEIQDQIRVRDSSTDRKAIASVEKALAEKLYWADVFKELSNVAPRSIWLTSFETALEGEGKKVVIAGSSTSQSEVAEFFSRLERSYFFRYVEIKFTEANEATSPLVFRFQFEGKLYDKKEVTRHGTN